MLISFFKDFHTFELLDTAPNQTKSRSVNVVNFLINALFSILYNCTKVIKKSKVSKKANEYEVNKAKSENFELDFSEENDMPKIKQVEQIEPKIPIQQQIIKLAKEGFSADLIASKLNLSISEVSMTIDLFL